MHPLTAVARKVIKAVVRGRRWFAELAANRAADTRAIAKREGLHDSYRFQRALKRVTDWCQRHRHEAVREQWVALKRSCWGTLGILVSPETPGRFTASGTGSAAYGVYG